MNEPAKPESNLSDATTAGGSDAGAAEGSSSMPGPEPTEAIDRVFGANAGKARKYHAWLADQATLRGLIGPREVPRLWERHILNCAVLSEVVPEGAIVADIGSGAGLPGIPLAIARPDATVILVEPLLRRTTFLDEVVADLGLANVRVVRGRAEDKAIRKDVGAVDVVTSRAVAPLGKLAGWSLPFVKSGGRMIAMKGSSAAEEIERDERLIRKARGDAPEIIEIGRGVVDTPTFVVDIRKK